MFDMSDPSNNAHPLFVSFTEDGTHNGGIAAGGDSIVFNDYGDYIGVNVSEETPPLYIYCGLHSGMGGALTIVEDAMDGEEDDNHAPELLVYEIGSDSGILLEDGLTPLSTGFYVIEDFIGEGDVRIVEAVRVIWTGDAYVEDDTDGDPVIPLDIASFDDNEGALVPEAETFSHPDGSGGDDDYDLPGGVEVMVTINAESYYSMALPMFDDLSVVSTDPFENEVFIGSSAEGSPELSISSGSSGVDMTAAITATTSPEMLHLMTNWFSIIDDLEALQDNDDPLDLTVALELDDGGDEYGLPLYGWHIEDMDLFKSFDASSLVDVDNPYAPDPADDPNYVETSIWKGSEDGTVLLEIQGGLVAMEGDPISDEDVGFFIADLFIDADDSFEEIV